MSLCYHISFRSSSTDTETGRVPDTESDRGRDDAEQGLVEPRSENRLDHTAKKKRQGRNALPFLSAHHHHFTVNDDCISSEVLSDLMV